MNLSRVYPALLLLLLAACGKSSSDGKQGGTVPNTEQPPNVVLIVLDTLRADRVEAIRDGVPVMPHLAALARESIYYPIAISPCSWTKPTMASVMTSLYGDVHGVHYGARDTADGGMTSDRLPEKAETLAEYLRERGYLSAAVQTNGNLRQEFGFAQGFAPERYDFNNDAPAQYVTDTALESLEGVDAPFFLYAHYMDPHAKYLFHEGYTDQYPETEGLTEDDRRNLDPAHQWDFFWDEVGVASGGTREKKTPEMSAAGKEEMRRLYDGECRYLDHQLKRLIGAVKAKDPNTVFIIFSDHGEEFWEHGGMGHGLTLYNEQLNIPLIMHGPDIPAERRELPTSTINILPTLASYLGFPVNPVWQGKDILAETSSTDPIFSLTHGSQSNTEQRYFLESLSNGTTRFIDDYGRGTSGLYDLSQPDTPEANLLDENPDAARNSRLILSEWRAMNDALRVELFGADYAPPGESVRATTGADESAGATGDVAMNEEHLAALEALGYLDSAVTDETTNEATPSDVFFIVVDGASEEDYAQPNPAMPGIARIAALSWRDGHCRTRADSADSLARMLVGGEEGPSSFFSDLGYRAHYLGAGSCEDIFGSTSDGSIAVDSSDAGRVTNEAIAALRDAEKPIVGLYHYQIDPENGAASRYVDAEILRLANYIDTNFTNTILIIATRAQDESTSFLIRLPGSGGKTIEGDVQVADVMPTIAAALDVSPSDAWVGNAISK